MQSTLIYTRQKEVFQLVVLSVWQPLSMLAWQRMRDVALGKLQRAMRSISRKRKEIAQTWKKTSYLIFAFVGFCDTFFPFSFLSDPLPLSSSFRPPPHFAIYDTRSDSTWTARGCSCNIILIRLLRSADSKRYKL
jgi:hypothetical protein